MKNNFLFIKSNNLSDYMKMSETTGHFNSAYVEDIELKKATTFSDGIFVEWVKENFFEVFNEMKQ